MGISFLLKGILIGLLFGLTFVSDFLLKYQTVINVLGGIRMFLSSFAVGIANPAAILTFLFAFSYFGITGKTGNRSFRYMNQVFGAVLAVFGVTVFIKTFI